MRFDTIEPPKNFIWVDSEVWQIDRLGLWTAQLGQPVPSAGHVDGDGWACIDADGQMMKTEQLSQVGKGRAAMRRRRWQRRIVSVPTY
jgi:hypothetical protein